MTDPYARVRTRNVAQTVQADDAQVENNASGYSFVTDWKSTLTRFLILGTLGGTYYSGQEQHTDLAVKSLKDIFANEGGAAVSVILDVSESGRAPKQNPTLFALALAASSKNDETRLNALSVISRVCRTGTHLFIFARYVEQFRGWGRGLRTEVARWYTEREVDSLAYQAVKYPQREGWSHRDMLRLSHPKTDDPQRNALFNWITHPDQKFEVPAIVEGVESLKYAGSPTEIAEIVSTFNLPWETVPSEYLNETQVWEAILPNLPLGAMLRQLPRLTRLGMLGPGEWRTLVTEKIADPAELKKARLHPLNILNGLMAYRKGQARSGGGFRPVAQVVDALDAAFYASFGNVTPMNKSVRLALDVSASMGWGTIAGTSLTPREATAALALVTAATEPEHEIVAFCDTMQHLTISPRQRIDDVINMISNLPWGGTDCALPMLDADKRNLGVDVFAIYTDNETWAGAVHPHVALQMYRDHQRRPDARCVVVGMTATEFTIAAPRDDKMLDVVGFDTATPELISAFGRGEV